MRTARTNGSTAYSYVYNGGSLSQMTVSSNTLYFAYDASATPLSVTYNGTAYYYATNLQGDITAILNTSGTAVVTYTYDAWGNIFTTGGSMASTLGTHNPLRYRGYVYDTETGLYYLQSRYYDPEMGRFITSDTAVSTGQGLTGNNTFAYCGNNPVVRADHSGDAWETIWDIISLASSVAEVVANPYDPWAWAGLLGDVIDVALPCVGGLGEAVDAAKTTVRVIDGADDVIDTAKTFQRTADAADDIKDATGTYVILYDGGKHYVGKGGYSRAITSAQDHASDAHKVSAIIWAPTSSKNSAFVAEYLVQTVYGVGQGVTENFNKIWSPGRGILARF